MWMKRRRNVQYAGRTRGNTREAWFDSRWCDCPCVTHRFLSAACLIRQLGLLWHKHWTQPTHITWSALHFKLTPLLTASYKHHIFHHIHFSSLHTQQGKANFPSMCKGSTAVDKSKPSGPAKKKVMEPEPSEISELITYSDSEEKAHYEEADTEPLWHQKHGPSHSTYMGCANVQVLHSHTSPTDFEDDDDDDDDDDAKSRPHWQTQQSVDTALLPSQQHSTHQYGKP